MRFLFPRVESPSREGRSAAAAGRAESRALGQDAKLWAGAGRGARVGSAAGTGPSAGLLRVGLDHSLVLVPGCGGRGGGGEGGGKLFDLPADLAMERL